MSHVDDLVIELRAMAAGVGQAQTKTAAVDAKARDVTAEAARVGFARIAAALAPLRQGIGQVAAALASLKGTVGDTVTVVAAVSKSSSPDDTVAILGKAGQQVEAVHAGIAAALAKVEETKRLVGMVLRGGQPDPLLSALDTVKEVLDLVGGHCGVAKQHLESATRAARQVGASGKLNRADSVSEANPPEEPYRKNLGDWYPDTGGKLPKSWGAGTPNKKGVGFRWQDPDNPGNGVRIDQGIPDSPWPSQRVDHVVVRYEGKVIGRDGKPIKGSIKHDPANAHIPLSEWINWSSWSAP